MEIDMTRSSTLCAIAVLTLTATSMSASANILLNPGFENGSAADANDWNEVSGPAGSVTRSSEQPNSGSFSARMEIDHISNPAAGAAYFIEQSQPAGSIDNSKNYNLTFQARSATTNFDGIDMFYQILWIDQDASDGGGVKGESLIPLIPAGLNTTYQPFSLLDINVPDGADAFLLRFQASAGAVANIANTLYVDDASLSVVPEPASALLLATTLIALRRRAA